MEDVEVQVGVDLLQKGLAGLAGDEGCKVEAVAVGDGAGEVVVAGDLRGEFLFRVDLLVPDVEAFLPVVEGVGTVSAVAPFDVHDDTVRKVLPHVVAVDPGAVVGAAEDGVARDHGYSASFLRRSIRMMA